MGTTFMLAVSDFVGFACDVATTFTVGGFGGLAGAVKVPFASIVPHAAVQAVPFWLRLQVTAWSEVLLTAATNWTVRVTPTSEIPVGLVLMVTVIFPPVCPPPPVAQLVNSATLSSASASTKFFFIRILIRQCNFGKTVPASPQNPRLAQRRGRGRRYHGCSRKAIVPVKSARYKS